MFIVWSVIGIASSSSSPGSANVFRASGWATERDSPTAVYANAGSSMSVISGRMVSLSIMGGGGGHLLSGLPSFFALYGIDIQVSLQR